ncbi:rhomboid family intramembrane serine protease [Spirulina sp. CS-785/01]|uniref:rhomboid family intramembrane serine protease n=1 Tax=Spirulina sp. CS-785/01 TaxID=3021716 RepID=UPI00232B03C9|nr:rhomboid family intramembrane serine protease [Spirulina sp. CS-785/01]MDB9311941.1 rhomboid family intramembrane serine protease [Spirulina sp. CS-785/01]
MLKRQTSGEVACLSCRQQVSVKETRCPHCGRKNPSLWGYAQTLQQFGLDLGVVSLITWGCIGLYLVTLVADWQNIGMSGGFLGFLSPSLASLVAFGATGAMPVFALHRWWTVLSATWLHGSLLHIAFNLLWVRHLAPDIAYGYGAARLLIIFILSGATGAFLTSGAGEYLTGFLRGAPLAVGASGGVFGLFGALVSYGHATQDTVVRKTGLVYALVGFVYGLLVPNVDNWGHFGGFLGGLLLTQLPGFHPLQPEKQWHWLGAVVLFLLTVGSVVFSVVHLWLLARG